MAAPTTDTKKKPKDMSDPANWSDLDYDGLFIELTGGDEDAVFQDDLAALGQGEHDENQIQSPNNRLECSSSGTRRPPSLFGLCLKSLEDHFEANVKHLKARALDLPKQIKKKALAVSRRKHVLNDTLLTALVDEPWDTLDLSGSQVTDKAMLSAISFCIYLSAIDISNCPRISEAGVKVMLERSLHLEILRCGGSNLCDMIMKKCVDTMREERFRLTEVDTWEDHGDSPFVPFVGPKNLMWIVWPGIDVGSERELLVHWPNLGINKKSEDLPDEANAGIALDEVYMKLEG